MVGTWQLHDAYWEGIYRKSSGCWQGWYRRCPKRENDKRPHGTKSAMHELERVPLDGSRGDRAAEIFAVVDRWKCKICVKL